MVVFCFVLPQIRGFTAPCMGCLLMLSFQPQVLSLGLGDSHRVPEFSVIAPPVMLVCNLWSYCSCSGVLLAVRGRRRS